VTVAGDPAARVVTVPTEIVAAVPVAPCVPCGIPKSKIAAEELPVLLTVAGDPAASVVTVPTEIVAAEPVAPCGPALPCAPALPAGIPNANTAAEELPVFVTVAADPAGRVVTLPAVIVAALPAAPVAPVAPVLPRGIVKSRIADVDVPTFVTDAEDPAVPVLVLPTATDTTVGPVAPCGPVDATSTDCVIGETVTVFPLPSTISTV
jgi:hypothetical protein